MTDLNEKLQLKTDLAKEVEKLDMIYKMNLTNNEIMQIVDNVTDSISKEFEIFSYAGLSIDGIKNFRVRAKKPKK